MIVPWWLLPLAGLLTWILLYPFTALLLRRQMLDIPNERSSHRRPTPRGGGVVLVGVVLVLWLVVGLIDPPEHPELMRAAGVAAALIALLGWVDDLYSLSGAFRLALQLGIAAATLAVLGVDEPAVVRWAWLFFAWFALVYLTNAYNFMDGIDGIAGGQAVVAGLAWAGLGWILGQRDLIVPGLLLSGAALGFLAHNWSPARIFMGDVGSTFLGFLFAMLPVLAVRLTRPDHLPSPALILAGILIVWPFVFDTSLTLLRRLSRRENIFAAHRTHLYQRLVSSGYSHRFVSGLYIGCAMIGAALGIGAFWIEPEWLWIVALVLVGLCAGLYGFVAQAERKA